MTNQPPPPPPRVYPNRTNDAPRPRRPGPLAAAITAAIALVAATAAGISVQTQERPARLATALMAPIDCDWRIENCVAPDMNVRVWADGRTEITEPRFDAQGHAALPEWRADLGPLAVPFAPQMGWDLRFMSDVARKQRPLRYCAEERRRWDAQHPGFDTAGIGVAALVAVFAPFDVLPVEEDCARADLVMGANAETDCGTGTWGCAAPMTRELRPYENTAYVRVTFNGAMLAAGQMPPSAVRAVDWHEDKHAGDLGHVGVYGGEGRAHPHLSDLTYVCVTGGVAHACGNGADQPASEDWDDGTGAHTNRYGLQFKPADPPPPPPCEAEAITQVWQYVGLPGQDWQITEMSRATVPVGDGRWLVVVVNTPDGAQTYSSFVGVAPCRG